MLTATLRASERQESEHEKPPISADYSVIFCLTYDVHIVDDNFCSPFVPPMRGPPAHQGLAFTAPATDQENELLTTFTTDTENEYRLYYHIPLYMLH